VSRNEWDETADVEPELARIAEQVAEATPVDWPEGEATAGTLAGLRALESLARAHRQAGAEFDSRAASPPRPPALFVWGPLEVIEPLARGSSGEVFRAFDPALGREVALKLRHDEAGPASSAARWIEEARRLARVRHPHVLTVYGTGVFAGRAGLWTELVSGETLEQLLARQGPCGAKEAVAIGMDLCAALAAVHAEGLVHGDLTPRNVMRAAGREAAGPAGSGRIVLMDFGSAHERSLEDAEAWSIGTPLACAPEVLAGSRPDARADLYSFGVVLFRLVTGRYPVEAATLAELRARHGSGERLALRALRPDLPAAFVRVVERALEPDPAKRYADVAALERDLGAAWTSEASAPAPAPAARGPLLLAALAGAALVTLALVFWPRAGSSPETPKLAITTNPADTLRAPAPGTGAAGPDAGAGPTAPAQGESARPLVARAGLYRGTGEGASEVADGSLLAVGDHLHLEIEPFDSVCVYVLDEDRSGRVVVMFPVANVDVANPIAGGAVRRLPGSVGGRAFDWQVTSAGGTETFLIVASRRPLAAIEQQVAALEHATPGHEVAYAALSAQALHDLRGVAGMVPAPDDAPAAPGGALRSLARRLAREPRGEVWTRLVHARNPGP